VSLEVVLKSLYKYICGVSFIDISYELNIHRNTVGKICWFGREAILEFLAENSEMLGGLELDGNAKVVEVDESLLFKESIT
jgi:hypothetical protein